jgi:hypothetical protein
VTQKNLGGGGRKKEEIYSRTFVVATAVVKDVLIVALLGTMHHQFPKEEV